MESDPVQPGADEADLRLEHQHPQHRRHGGRHRVGPDQHGAVEGAAADLAVGEDRQQQCDAHGQHRHATQNRAVRSIDAT